MPLQGARCLTSKLLVPAQTSSPIQPSRLDYREAPQACLACLELTTVILQVDPPDNQLLAGLCTMQRVPPCIRARSPGY